MTKTDELDRDPRSVILGALRRMRGLSPLGLADLSGHKESALAQAEKGGSSAPSHQRLEVLSVAMSFVRELAPFLVSLLHLGGTRPAAPQHPLQPSPEEVRRRQSQALQEGHQFFLRTWDVAERIWYEGRVVEHRTAARKMGEEILALHVAKQRKGIDARVEADPAPLWALVEWLCEASEKAASDNARTAVHLAKLALYAASSAHVPVAWRDRLVGYAWAFLANARRVSGNLPAADEAFQIAWERWKKGADSELPLGEWLILDMEASLRSAQNRWLEMFRLRKLAIASAPKHAKGILLLSQSAGFILMREPMQALKVLRKARPLIIGAGDRRLEFGVLFNLANTLEQLGELDEAEELLPDVRKRAVTLQNELDLLRVLWLQARIDGARRRTEEAADALAQVGRGFAVREIAYDTAQAGLEEGVLRLVLGETERARQLALDMHWIFRAQQVQQSALAALHLYCQAAQDDRLTLDLARQALAEFRQAGRGPNPATAP